jgi:hypothetical protein
MHPMIELFLSILVMATWVSPTIYAFHKNVEYRWSVLIFNFWMCALPPGVGPYIQLWFLHRRVKNEINARRKAEHELDTWNSEKVLFLDEYVRSENESKESAENFLTKEEQDKNFFSMFPDANLYSGPVSARDFEFVAESWMKYWGVLDAEATTASGDGGIDVISSRFAAQVKFYANSKVGRPELQNLYGAAQGLNLGSLFFAYSSGYSDLALAWAEQVGVGCFAFVPNDNGNGFVFKPLTPVAMDLVLENEGIDYSTFKMRSELKLKAQNLRITHKSVEDFYKAPVRFSIYSETPFEFLNLFKRRTTSSTRMEQ